MKKFFDTGCWYCGSDEHRRPDCPKLSATLKARGLRKVDGQWVAGGDPEQEEDFYINLLSSDGREACRRQA